MSEEIEVETPPLLDVMAVIEESQVNGPGSRVVIWTQGCGKGCKGCFNPESWKYTHKSLHDPEELAHNVQTLNPWGLTLSGGDPLEQPVALRVFLNTLHDSEGFLEQLPGGIILFTGYTREEVFEQIELPAPLTTEEERTALRDCWNLCDLVIDGKFVESLKYSNALAGSTNQRFWFSSKPGRGRDRVDESAVMSDQAVEIHSPDAAGLVRITGFPDINHKYLRSLGLRVITD